MIEVKDLTKIYGETYALNKVNLSVNKGEVISIIGPSGSGKSTLLRTIIDLETITSGVVYIEGHDIKHENLSKQKKKEIMLKTGMVFQNFNLFPHMSVGENIQKTLLVVKKVSISDAKLKTKEVLEKVGLSDKINNYPNELSGGQKQRVAIARAMALNPDILLFDEPTSALDPELVKEVLDIIRKLKDEKITMMIVSHEMKFVRDISDRIVVMEKGSILEVGTAEKIFENPDTVRVKEFLQE
ncbi:MAG: amino acid ABC transporter ATP-binding protein [Leptotrichiaceae bacterium]|nr:amino acid ABC transporter ATP-binding protein [Leptotrichiaceae bacterium]MBP9876463.1 amino acid ABC transporter ATP-binding protein [Leptotrichiaceae bacterium]